MRKIILSFIFIAFPLINLLVSLLELSNFDKIIRSIKLICLRKSLAWILIDGKFETEASGGINMHTARAYAECGVDYISVGALTHSVSNMDLSLKAI